MSYVVYRTNYTARLARRHDFKLARAAINYARAVPCEDPATKYLERKKQYLWMNDTITGEGVYLDPKNNPTQQDLEQINEVHRKILDAGLEIEGIVVMAEIPPYDMYKKLMDEHYCTFFEVKGTRLSCDEIIYLEVETE